MKEKVLDVTLWRTRFGRGYGPVVRQKTIKDANLKGKKYECVGSIYLAQERGQVTSSSEYTNES